MLKIIIRQLNSLNNWFSIERETIQEIDEISKLENDADKNHKLFLRKLYSENVTFKEFNQGSLLDQILEDITDSIERLSRQIHIILNEYRSLTSPPPRYLP